MDKTVAERTAPGFEDAAGCGDPPPVESTPAPVVHPIGHTTYDEQGELPIRGTVYYPAEQDGVDAPFSRTPTRAPIVLIAHGNYAAEVPSHLGYDYFQQSLARVGIVAVSVDCTSVNDWVDDSSRIIDSGGSSGIDNIEQRTDLIIDSFLHFQKLDTDPASLFHGRIDFRRVGLMGHSRGGEAAVEAAPHLGRYGADVLACLALAPSEFGYLSGVPAMPAGFSFMTILPAADDDMDTNPGAQYYDQAVPHPFKSQVYVHHANHNFFNRQWITSDTGRPVLLRSEHERILDVYGSAFFRARLLGHDTNRYLDRTVLPDDPVAGVVYLAYLAAGQFLVDDHDHGKSIGTNRLGLPVTTIGSVHADEYPFDQMVGQYNGTFFGLTTGMVMEPTARSGGSLRTEVGQLDLTGSEVWLRVAEVARPTRPATATGFALGLEDADHTIGWIDSDTAGGVPRPYYRPTELKTMLSTMRFRPRCARTENAPLDLSRIVAILIRLDGPRARAIAFDDLYIVTP